MKVDKTKFKCYKFPDNSIYFGEVCYENSAGNSVKLFR